MPPDIYDHQIQGLVTQANTKIQVVDPKEAGHDLMRENADPSSKAANSTATAPNVSPHVFKFQMHIHKPPANPTSPLTLPSLHSALSTWLPELPLELTRTNTSTTQANGAADRNLQEAVTIRTLRLTLAETTLDAAWEWADESLAMYVLCVVRKILQDMAAPNNVDNIGQPQLMCYE